ncbi:MAG: hypothetical protein M3072_00365 [Candidatus Dormibacteraeota bacterium]|nr:hypothetical protein [Candidatus Dormibacteraeota bacterium]
MPAHHPFDFAQAVPTRKYTTILNLLFLGLVAVPVVRSLSTGGRQMLQVMDAVPEAGDSEGRHAHAQ